MDTPSSSLRPTIGIVFLGVHFFWPERKPGFERDNLNAFDEPGAQILKLVDEPMRRQKRSRLKYWDAITYLDRISIPDPVAISDEAELADRLIGMLARRRFHTQTIRELAALPALADAHTRLAHYSGKRQHEYEAELVVSRGDPTPIEYGRDGNIHPIPPGFYRLMEINMDTAGMKSNALDWHRLMILAVLFQIRADLEIHYETGFMRLRKCEHRQCGAWFVTKRMAGRQRFCSTLCRVTEARDVARKGPTRRRPRKQ